RARDLHVHGRPGLEGGVERGGHRGPGGAVEPLAGHGGGGGGLGLAAGCGRAVLEGGGAGGVGRGADGVAAGGGEPPGPHHEEQEGDEQRHDDHQLDGRRPLVAARPCHVTSRAGPWSAPWSEPWSAWWWS